MNFEKLLRNSVDSLVKKPTTKIGFKIYFKNERRSKNSFSNNQNLNCRELMEIYCLTNKYISQNKLLFKLIQTRYKVWQVQLFDVC